jgi:hypothetical protein
LDNAGDCVERLSYVEAIHSQCRFCKLKMLYMFKTFVSLLSGHASYLHLRRRQWEKTGKNCIMTTSQFLQLTFTIIKY